ncbi:MAG: hypothetical protein HYZ45_05910 [Burkholderiales bacterium]|nr:hypothetical protein [Burkholderiales bacterium]
MHSQHFAQLSDLLACLDACAEMAATTVLVKGSRYMKMERVVQPLLGQEISVGAH